MRSSIIITKYDIELNHETGLCCDRIVYPFLQLHVGLVLVLPSFRPAAVIQFVSHRYPCYIISQLVG
jgi:hypothetical protein